MISFTLNGKPVSSDAPADTPLLWVIRDEIGLTGTKFGCGVALCGACTIHLNGDAIRACVTPLAVAEGAELVTIEGLAGPDGPHALQTAWVEEQVPQCGYCQSGQIMQAAVLLRDNPEPTDADIAAAMNGNLCRCMAYPRIKSAIKRAARAVAAGG
jgi:isoquinoline 1-oxidoreductase alpha subunit